MAIIVREIVQSISFPQQVIAANGSTVPIYGTVEAADNYFATMLEGQRWEYTSRLQKVRALSSATKRIDRLNFKGVQTDPAQPLQFPRGMDTVVPVEVEQACYELALALLSGVDPNTEVDNLSATVQAYGPLRSEFDRSSILPYVRAGIPSLTAWTFLYPFIDPVQGIAIRRVS